MDNLRKYGSGSFRIAVIHGGPGAAGEMAPVARELSRSYGILEPLQTAVSLDGQVEELKSVLENEADGPVTLVGFSWGAWLSVITAAKFPAVVEKLVLIGSGPFEEKYAQIIQENRLNRLNPREKTEFESILKTLNDPSIAHTDDLVKRLGKLVSKTDTYEPIDQFEEVECNGEIFQNVWPQAANLRSSGKLLELATQVKCPVVAIHGEYDPHPGEGVQKPFAGILKNFSFFELKKCGHKPWIERHAMHKFFQILRQELL